MILWMAVGALFAQALLGVWAFFLISQLEQMLLALRVRVAELEDIVFQGDDVKN